MAHLDKSAHRTPKYNRFIYANEDPAKKLTRFMWWQEARKQNPELFYSKCHLVLAGYGGDIGVLLGMGVDPSLILAIDENIDCVSACKAHFPGVVVGQAVLTPTSRGFFNNPAGSLATAMLDFCGAPTRSNRRIMRAVTDHLLDPAGVLGCTFLTSRGSAELAHTGQRVAEKYAIEDPALIRSQIIADELPGWYPAAGYQYQSHQERQTHSMFTLMFTRREPKHAVHIIPVKATKDDIKAAILATDERPAFDAALMLNVPRMTVAGWKAHATRRQQTKE